MKENRAMQTPGYAQNFAYLSQTWDNSVQGLMQNLLQISSLIVCHAADNKNKNFWLHMQPQDAMWIEIKWQQDAAFILHEKLYRNH